jgi:phosphoserine/homoserine phosphotransferase
MSQETSMPKIICLDMEGVVTPEIWIAFSEATGIPELKRTTRDEPDYDKLMRGRLQILDRHGLELPDIQRVIDGMRPLAGAREFLDRLRAREQVIILSDTFYQFAAPLLRQLGQPTLFCNDLLVDDGGRVVDYKLRIPDGKRRAVESLRQLGFDVRAGGDSYNDMGMLKAANRGVLFRCPDNVARELPQFPRTETYEELWRALLE